MRYTLTPREPAAHRLHCMLELDRPQPGGQRLSLPAWIPGSYMIRDFARHVVEFRAHADGRSVDWSKLDKQTWQCAPVDGPLTVEWVVHAWDPSVRAAAIDDTGGFFNGTSVFLRPEGLADGPFDLSLCPPQGPVQGHWRAVTTMPPTAVHADGFGDYRAADYEELTDHPVLLGECRCLSFEVAGVSHEIVLPGDAEVDGDRLTRDVAAACRAHIDLFGSLPVDRYVFFVNVVPSGRGGLEHRASSMLEVARDALPLPGDPAEREPYLELLGLFSHEYFHLWHVKRIRPAALAPPDLGREVHTTLLWAFEGITSYYDDLSLCRARLIDRRQYLDGLAQVITRVHRGRGRLRQTLSDSSFDAWTRFYKQDENAPNAIVSYYAKGALVALALDLTVRSASGGRRSLDDVMRALWLQHGDGQGVEPEELERLSAEVAGLELAPFFDGALRSVRELDLATPLAQVGIALEWRQPAPSADYLPGLGIAVDTSGELARVTRVFDQGPARAAGIAARDRLVAIDGIHRGGSALVERAGRLEPDRVVEVHLLRGDRLLVRRARVAAAPRDQAVLRRMDDPDPVAADLLDDWLGQR